MKYYLNLFIFTGRKFTFAKHEHVCKTRSNIRDFLCDELLQFDTNGFYTSLTTHLKCKSQSFTVQFLTLVKPTKLESSYFTCPQLWYFDLETREKKNWPYTYKVSNAREYDSAILFVQIDVEATNILYPQKYIKHIDFTQFKVYRPYKSSSSAPVELMETFEKSKDDLAISRK